MGLVLIALLTPNLESPPTNSLPPRLCPLRGVVASGVSGVLGGVCSSLSPDASAALKEKLGSADVVLLCGLLLLLAPAGCVGGERPRCIETGRRLPASEPD